MSFPFRQNAFSLAYISRLSLPNPAANALQTILMMSELSDQGVDALLFVRDLLIPQEDLENYYGIHKRFPIRSLNMKSWPGFISRSNSLRSPAYNTAAALNLHSSFHREKRSGGCNVLLVRSKSEILYWGTIRSWIPCFRDWVFVCEMHDLPQTPASKNLVRSLANYDLVLAVTEALASDIRRLSGKSISPAILPSATGLERLSSPPSIRFSKDRILLGYTGTTDHAHGIDDLFGALKILPENFHLRITGRVPLQARRLFDDRLADPSLKGRMEYSQHKRYADMAAEIDSCDIMLVPAGQTVHSERYRSPLKLFDYMARGKPVVAAGVSGNLQVLAHRKNALIYKPHDPEDLARYIKELAANSSMAQAIATEAWKLSAGFTYKERARRLLDLVGEVLEQKKKLEEASL